MENKKLIDELKKYCEINKDKYGFKKVVLFGSRANGNYDDKSDIDLLVDFHKKENKKLLTLSGIANELENKFNLKVDIFTYPINKEIINRGFYIEKEINIYE